jgi:hypothetical protein
VAHHVDAGYGRFVITSSASGMWGRVEGANYAAAKTGLVGLCNVLAVEGEAKGILANAIMPVPKTRLAGAPEESDTTAQAQAARAQARQTRGSPEWVTPMAVYLASDQCDRTHRYYSAIGGRYAEIFVAVNDGWVAPAGQPPTVEELVAHLDVVEDRSAHSVPHNTFDEIAIAKRRIDSEIGTATIDGGMPVLK